MLNVMAQLLFHLDFGSVQNVEVQQENRYK